MLDNEGKEGEILSSVTIINSTACRGHQEIETQFGVYRL